MVAPAQQELSDGRAALPLPACGSVFARSSRKYRVRVPLRESELRGKAPSRSASPPLRRGPLSRKGGEGAERPRTRPCLRPGLRQINRLRPLVELDVSTPRIRNERTSKASSRNSKPTASSSIGPTPRTSNPASRWRADSRSYRLRCLPTHPNFAMGSRRLHSSLMLP